MCCHLVNRLELTYSPGDSILRLIKNKASDRPCPTRENGPDPIFTFFFKLNFLNSLKLRLNDSGFSLGLVQKCLLSTKLDTAASSIKPDFLSYNKYRYMYFHHCHHLLFTSYRTWTKRHDFKAFSCSIDSFFMPIRM